MPHLHQIVVPNGFWGFWQRYYNSNIIKQAKMRQDDKYEHYNDMLHHIEDIVRTEMNV